MHSFARCFLVLFVMLVGSACSAGTQPLDASTDADDGDGGVRPAGIETSVPEMLTAGSPISAACTFVDASGMPIEVPGAVVVDARYSPSDSVQSVNGVWIATRVGTIEAQCESPTFNLVDTSPSRITIVAGPPALVATRVDHTRVAAGETVHVTCDVYDAFGNAITPPPAAAIELTPTDTGNTVSGNAITLNRAGVFTVACEIPGTLGEGVDVEATPGAPASISVTRVPDQPIYSTNEVIEFRTEVIDALGNVIPTAMVDFTSMPGGTMVGERRYRYTADGRYTVHAQLSGVDCTRMAALCTSTSFLVDGSGPGIVCGGSTGPGWDGTAINGGATSLTLPGRVSDASGIRSVRVNGTTVPVTAGAFDVTLTPRFGMNFVEIAATDSTGRENSRVCTFLLGNRWQSESTTMPDVATLQLRQPAIDDGSRSGAATSLADLLQTALNSSGLHTTLNTLLLSRNPYKPMRCDVSALGVCLFSSRVDYVSGDFAGSHTAGLTLVDGGVRLAMRLTNVGVQVRISGTYNNTGWVRFSSLDVNGIVDMGFNTSTHRPTARVRSGSVTVTVGTVTLDFPGFTGFIAEQLTRIFQSQVQSAIANAVRDYIASEGARTLESVVSGLDVTSLRSSFNVPRFDGSGNVTVNFAAEASSVSFNTSRGLFGIGARLYAARTTRMSTTPGVWQMPGTTYRDDPTNTRPAAASVHIGVIDEALHALWRGGFFDARIAGGSLPSGASATLRTNLPPIAQFGTGGAVNMELGAVDAEVTYPALFSTPFRVRLGGVATTSVSLVGESLRFSSVNVTTLHASLLCDASTTAGSCPSLDASQRMQLENFLRQVLQQVVDTSLNSGLPSIPIPSFSLPSSLTAYGLPGGRTLGLTSPTLTVESPHFVLRAGFGVR